MSGSGRLRRVSSVRCCGRKAFTGLSAARGRRGLAAAVTYVGGLEESMNGACPPIGEPSNPDSAFGAIAI